MVTIKKYKRFKEVETSSPFYDVDLKPLNKEIEIIINIKTDLQITSIKEISGLLYIELEDKKEIEKGFGILTPFIKNSHIFAMESYGRIKPDGLKWEIKLTINFEIKGSTEGHFNHKNWVVFLNAKYDFNTKKWEFIDRYK